MGIMMKCGCAAQSVCSSRGGQKFDPPIPSCVIHDCIEVADTPHDLTGRMARCSCGATKPSSPSALAFFTYRGPCSLESTETCKCGLYRSAHSPEKPHVKCKEFIARGPNEFDSFYCGCRGWD